MKIIVLAKQVLATETGADNIEDVFGNYAEDTGTWIMNPPDEIAVEEALRIKETHGGSVTILSFGKKFAVEIIRKALAMGADRGVLILDGLRGDYRDSLSVARILSAFLKKTSFDLLLAGGRSVDGHNFLVGPALAEMLEVPCVSMVVRQEIRGKIIRCDKITENGKMIVDAPLPAMLTAASGLNTPRYATLPGIRRAKKKKVRIVSLSEIAMDKAFASSLSKVVAFRQCDNRRQLKMAVGDSPEKKARWLVRRLHQEAGVI